MDTGHIGQGEKRSDSKDKKQELKEKKDGDKREERVALSLGGTSILHLHYPVGGIEFLLQ